MQREAISFSEPWHANVQMQMQKDRRPNGAWGAYEQGVRGGMITPCPVHFGGRICNIAVKN